MASDNRRFNGLNLVVVVLVVMALQIVHVCELAVVSLLIGVLQESFIASDGYQQFCSKEAIQLLRKFNTIKFSK